MDLNLNSITKMTTQNTNKGENKMIGSIIQTAWAEQIRQEFTKYEVSFNDIACAIVHYLPLEEKTKIRDHFIAIGQPAAKILVEEARELFKAESSAKFWIENRRKLASELIIKFIRIN